MFDKLLAKAEKTPLGYVLLAFLSVTVVRIIEEYLLEAGHAVEPFSSYLLLFLFYATVFAGAVVVAAFFTSQSLRSAAGVVALFYPLVWLAPILDFFFSGGKGYALTYAYSTTFWDALTTFCGTCTGISPGIRVEVLGILIVFVWYVHRKTASLLCGIAASVVYYLFLLFNALPQSIFRELFGYTTENIFLYREIIAFYVVFLTLFGLYFLYREFPALWSSFTQHVHPLRALHYLSLTLFGVALSFQKFAHPLPGVVFPLASALASVFFAFQAALLVNDFFDAPMDRKYRNTRPTQSWPLAWFFLTLSILNALAVGYTAVALILFALGLSWAYSAPPLLRVRWHFVPASLVIALCSLAVFWIGYISGFMAQENALAQMPSAYSILVLGYVFLISPFKDLKDAALDKSGGVQTLPTIFGEHGVALTAALVVGGVVWAAFWASLPWWLAAFLALLAASAIVLVENSKRRETILFALHYGFIGLLAIWLNGIRFGIG